jgi:hypothetical protein
LAFARRFRPDRRDVALFQEVFADLFAGAAFEEDIVGQHHGGATVDHQEREYVPEEVELLVARLGPEILAYDRAEGAGVWGSLIC